MTLSEVNIKITGDSGQIITALNQVVDDLHKTTAAVQKNRTSWTELNSGLSVLKQGFGQVFSVLGGMIDSVRASEVANTKLEAVLKSTGGAAGMTKESLGSLTKELKNETTATGNTIKEAEHMLLTFTKVGKDVFPLATETVLNMSAALGQDAKSSAIQLGKALNDPIGGVTALRRVGVMLDDQQKANIETLMKQGKQQEAQKVILAELQTEFGGMARALADTPTGKMEQLENAIGELKKTGGLLLLEFIQPLVPIIGRVVEAVREVAATVQKWTAVLFDHTKAEQSQVREMISMNRESMEYLRTQEKAVRETPKLAEEYEKLAGKQKKTADDSGRMKDILVKMNETYPDVVKSTKVFAGSLDQVKTAAAGVNDKLKDLHVAQLRLQRETLDFQRTEAELGFLSQQEKLESAAANFASRIKGSYDEQKKFYDAATTMDQRAVNYLTQNYDAFMKSGKNKEAADLLAMRREIQATILAREKLEVTKKQIEADKQRENIIAEGQGKPGTGGDEGTDGGKKGASPFDLGKVGDVDWYEHMGKMRERFNAEADASVEKQTKENQTIEKQAEAWEKVQPAIWAAGDATQALVDVTEDWAETLEGVGQIFGDLQTIAGDNFEMGKAVSTAQALINTYEAASKALTAGPILGPILMATTIAAGLAQVMKIQSTKPQKKYHGGEIEGRNVAYVNEEGGSEFVMNSRATEQNRSLLRMLNSGQSIADARGGVSMAGAGGRQQFAFEHVIKLPNGYVLSTLRQDVAIDHGQTM